MVEILVASYRNNFSITTKMFLHILFIIILLSALCVSPYQIEMMKSLCTEIENLIAINDTHRYIVSIRRKFLRPACTLRSIVALALAYVSSATERPVFSTFTFLTRVNTSSSAKDRII